MIVPVISRTIKLLTLFMLFVISFLILWSSHVHISIGDEFDLQHCPCKRNTGKNIQKSAISYSDTTCSYDAFWRGPGQKVVSFTFYGGRNSEMNKVKGYIEGIRENLELVKKYYPGWIMRLYYDVDPGDSVIDDLCSLACASDILDLCYTGKLPGNPFKDVRNVVATIWRFIPTLDPQVDIVVSRDLDSRIGDREAAAVEEWMLLGKPIHSMRDHPYQNAEMNAGMWGSDMRTEIVQKNWKISWKKMFEDKMSWAPRNARGQDQTLLKMHVWTWANNMTVEHDSYICRYFRNSIGFPTERRKEPANFVGAIVYEQWTYWEECPKECRRKEHPDWLHC